MIAVDSGIPVQFLHRSEADVPVYLLGCAYDGPMGVPVRVRSVDEVDSTFAGKVAHWFAYTPGQSTVTLTLKSCRYGWQMCGVGSSWVPVNVRRIDDYSFAFDPVSLSGEAEVRYYPKPTFSSYLPALARVVLSFSPQELYLVRVAGGRRAMASTGSLKVEARYEGALYNGTTVTFYDDGIEVAPLHRPPTRYYVSHPKRVIDQQELDRWPVLISHVGSFSWPPSGTQLVLDGGRSAPLVDVTLLDLVTRFEPSSPGAVIVPFQPRMDVAHVFYAAMFERGCTVHYALSLERLRILTS